MDRVGMPFCCNSLVGLAFQNICTFSKKKNARHDTIQTTNVIQVHAIL